MRKTVKPVKNLPTCWAVIDEKQNVQIHTIAETKKQAIILCTSGFYLWKNYYDDGYRVRKFKLVPIES